MAVSAIAGLVSTGTGVLSGSIVAGAGFFGSSLAGAAASHFLVTTALGAALNALTPKQKTLSGVDSPSRGYQVTQTGSALDHQIIYGKVKVAGVRVFDGSTGNNNQYLHRVLAFSGHEIESFDTIYLNDEQLTIDGSGNVTSPSSYSGKIRIKKHLGSPDQAADSSLVSEYPDWTSSHRLRGIAYLYVRFNFDPDTFPNGIPKITAKIKGKKVYDPRTGLTSWSNNPALCIRDYLTNSRYGLGEDNVNVDDSLVTTAANVCDQNNTPDGSTRYTCNGAFTTGSTPWATLSTLLTSMGGLLWYSQGKWRMKPAYWTAPVLSLDEDDLRGNLTVNTRHSRRDNYNTVRGTFRGEETNWQITDYPKVFNQDFLDADNGQESSIDLPLPFTDNSTEARRIANVSLERNRQQVTFSAPFGMRAFQLQVGDNVKITNSRFGWSEKHFEVTSWTFGLTEGLDLQVNMVLREISESVFDDVSDGIVYERDNTNLPDPLYKIPVGYNTSQTLRIINEQVTGVITVDVTSEDVFAREYKVQYKPSSNQNWVNVGSGPNGNYEIYVIEDGQYDIRVKSVSTLGVNSDWVYRTIDFKVFSEPPQQVQNFVGNVVGNSLHLSWDPVSDLDLSYYKIRFSPITSGANYSNAIDLVDKVSRPGNSVVVPSQTGTYFIKAVDKTGGLSEQPSEFVVLVDNNNIEELNVIANLVENPSFSGLKTNVIKTSDSLGDYLTLDTQIDFEDLTGNFDDALGLFDGGEGSVETEGFYYFSNTLDLGEKYTSRVKQKLRVDYKDYVNDFDSVSGNFDEREGDFDGDPNQFDTTSACIELRHTEDDPSGSPSWSDWQKFIVADISARAFEFRAILSSSNSAASPVIRELSVEVDMPDRTESEQDIVFTGIKNVVFPKAFKATPSLGITVANLADGERYVITNKSRSGFTIEILNGSTQSTNPVTLDYVAKGYGKELT